MSTLSSFMRNYMDHCGAADRCFRDVDDLGTAGHTFEELFLNLSEIFTCIRWAGLKLTMSKCEIRSVEINFREVPFPMKEWNLTSKKYCFFWTIWKCREVNQTRRRIGFFPVFSKAFIPQLSEKLLPLYHLLKYPRRKITYSIMKHMKDCVLTWYELVRHHYNSRNPIQSME